MKTGIKRKEDLRHFIYPKMEGTAEKFVLKDIPDRMANQRMSFDEEVFLIEQVERTQIMETRDTSNRLDYTMLAILFGYIGMFSTVDPIAPLVIFIAM